MSPEKVGVYDSIRVQSAKSVYSEKADGVVKEIKALGYNILTSNCHATFLQLSYHNNWAGPTETRSIAGKNGNTGP